MPTFAFLFNRFSATRLAARLGTSANVMRRVRSGARGLTNIQQGRLRSLYREVQTKRLRRVGITSRDARVLRDRSVSRVQESITMMEDMALRISEARQIDPNAVLRTWERFADIEEKQWWKFFREDYAG